ncbi:hypothetical protein ACLHDG_11245 [Sulfurovum sp. CS9]|uniref:hypothetical protein n=1 Tax=Sulfurovum sp. CS9 TaxID=3391146 RepID=UPI0039E77DD0
MKINKIINQQGITKKEFIIKLQSLEPNVNRIGNIPSFSSIYSYLNCCVPVPINLIPYIAITLNIEIYELFQE